MCINFFSITYVFAFHSDGSIDRYVKGRDILAEGVSVCFPDSNNINNSNNKYLPSVLFALSHDQTS